MEWAYPFQAFLVLVLQRTVGVERGSYLVMLRSYLFLALCSRILPPPPTPRFRRPYGLLMIELGPVICTARALLAVLSLTLPDSVDTSAAWHGHRASGCVGRAVSAVSGLVSVCVL